MMLLNRGRNTPRWVIFFGDLTISLFAISLAYLLRFNFKIPESELRTFWFVYPTMIGVRAVSFVMGKTYAGIIRYTGTKDAQRILGVLTAGSLLFSFMNVVRYFGYDGQFVIPFSVILIDYFTTTFFMVVIRIAVKVMYVEITSASKESNHIIIYGSGEPGITAKRVLDRDDHSRHRVIAFLDSTGRHVGKKLEGVNVYAIHDLEMLLTRNDVHQLIIASPRLEAAEKRVAVDICLHHDVKLLHVPPVAEWINGQLSYNQIKKVNILDLLNRAPIHLNSDSISKQIKGRRVMVTGAAGSIGSELAYQICKYKPKLLVLVDQAESDLHDLALQLSAKESKIHVEIVVGDIRHQERVANIFNTFQPQTVYHAAAYKHVPLMEDNPCEAIRTNVWGTKNLVDAAIAHKVTRFVMVSTDKAVNPTNVMGASKRIAEMYVQIQDQKGTAFVTTRFGNVLGSNGSVIPLFQKQILEGGPVTVTHPEVTRYFMTIPEASQLVLEAGAMGEGGEIYVFDMGASIRIADLAKKMIQLSGLKLGEDIEIEYVGLRPGEKLYEELLATEENTTKTHHPSILIAKVPQHNAEAVNKAVDELVAISDRQDNRELVTRMKNIVPEYVSNNSVFEALDEGLKAEESKQENEPSEEKKEESKKFKIRRIGPFF